MLRASAHSIAPSMRSNTFTPISEMALGSNERGPHSVILDQVTNGVAVRMAVLYLLAGGKPELADAAKRGAAPE